MLRVALTGGIATGKSTVLALLARRGVPAVDADRVAREVVAPGTAGFRAVVDRFGASIVGADGALDRPRLAAVVFADADARADLERIVHPAVYAAIAAWFAALPAGTSLAVADIPLLFETGRERDFDRVIVAACPPGEQVRRVMARDGLTEADARARLAAQWPIDRKVARAERVIWTTGTPADTERQVDALLRTLKAVG